MIVVHVIVRFVHFVLWSETLGRSIEYHGGHGGV
jgi:hypothetical protein